MRITRVLTDRGSPGSFALVMDADCRYLRTPRRGGNPGKVQTGKEARVMRKTVIGLGAATFFIGGGVWFTLGPGSSNAEGS